MLEARHSFTPYTNNGSKLLVVEVSVSQLDVKAFLQVPSNSLHYPPESLGKAIGSLFLIGGTSKAAFKAKLRVFLYMLLDSGQSKMLSSFG